MTPVPLLVVGGFLGAGKTTLIGHLLQHNQGMRLLVLVNDFGAINIDAQRIAQAGAQTIALTNGCVCCAMTGDLYYAVGDALARQPRPDAIVIEASGVAEPGRIAAMALAEPDLTYAGVVTMADAQGLPELLCNSQLREQVQRQLQQADLIALSRTDVVDATQVQRTLAQLTQAPVVLAPHGQLNLLPLLEELAVPRPSRHAVAEQAHGNLFAQWTGLCARPLQVQAVDGWLANLPPSVLRLKGWVTDDHGTREVQRVGQRLVQRRAEARSGSQLVAIGLAAQGFDAGAIQSAWMACAAACPQAR
jgi:G3E family GTPase